jgi:hypothetical protein
MVIETITSQAVGAYGEAAVTAELLRRGWMPANVNRTVKSAADRAARARRGAANTQMRPTGNRAMPPNAMSRPTQEKSIVP